MYKNLKLARSRAYALTVSSRRKPPQFWNQASQIHLVVRITVHIMAVGSVLYEADDIGIHRRMGRTAPSGSGGCSERSWLWTKVDKLDPLVAYYAGPTSL